MKLEFTITSNEDGGFVGECPAVGCITQGETVYEVLDNLSDAYSVSVAEQRSEDIRSGKVKTVSREEVMAHFGIEEPSKFERDLAEDMKDPEFAKSYEKTRAQLAIIESVLSRITAETEADGRFIASIDVINGCFAYGGTEHEARRKCGVLAFRLMADRLELNEVGE